MVLILSPCLLGPLFHHMFCLFPLGHSSWIVSSFSVSFEKCSKRDGMWLPESLTGRHNKMIVSPLKYSCFLLHFSTTAGCFSHRNTMQLAYFPAWVRDGFYASFTQIFYLLVSRQPSHELAHFGPRAPWGLLDTIHFVLIILFYILH